MLIDKLIKIVFDFTDNLRGKYYFCRVMTHYAIVVITMAVCFFSIASVSFAGSLPDTGQTGCYLIDPVTCPQEGEPYYGQDAQYDINPQSYTKMDESGKTLPGDATEWAVVKDNVTGLMWEIKDFGDGLADYSNPHDADNKYTWHDSNKDTNGGDVGMPGNDTDTEDIINALNKAGFGGYNDWRLPTAKELSLIVNTEFNTQYPVHNPAINTDYFPETKSYYWTSTAYVYHPPSAWVVDFDYGSWGTSFCNGGVYSHDKSDSHYVRAVRSPNEGSGYNYVINGDGTVTDISTGLMWQQETGSNLKWGEALDYCENLILAGYDDWRLPNRNELQSLVDYNTCSPAIDTTAFPDTVLYSCWSSTTQTHNNSDSAWHVDFLQGWIPFFSSHKSFPYRVRAVRGDGSLKESVADSSYDATGTWNYSMSHNWVNTYSTECQADADETGVATVTQNGNTVSMVTDGKTFSGSVDGVKYTLFASFPDNEGTTTIRSSFTLSSSTSGVGSFAWFWTDSEKSCNGGNHVFLTKQQDISGSSSSDGSSEGEGEGSGCMINSLVQL